MEAQVEFNEGRTKTLFIYHENFARRSSVSIIYPSKIVPIYSSTSLAFKGVANPKICAPSVFNFYTKQTTTNRASCPASIFKEKKKIITFNHNKRRLSIAIARLAVYLITKV